MRLPSIDTGRGNLTVTRVTDFNQGLLNLSPRDSRYWAGMSQFAKDAGDESFSHNLKAVADACTTVSNKDGLIPAERLISYDPRITLEQSSVTSDSNIDYEAFGFDLTHDPRAVKIKRYSAEIAGKVARFCCGTDPTTVGANLRAHETKRGWYSVGFDLCWTDQIEHEYAGMFDYMLWMQRLCMMVLQQARCEVAFLGDEQNNLRGLKQLPIKRLTLDKPLDEMTAREVYDIWTLIANHQELSYGERGITKNTLLHPKGLSAVFAQPYEATSGSSSCCMTLREMLGKVSDLPITMRLTDYMQEAGENNTPAAFFYNRSTEYFRRDIAYMPVWLAPQYECGRLRMQAIMRLGELDVTNPDAGLLISNFITGAC